MKYSRICLPLIAIATVLVAMTNRKMTIRCETSGESIEVTVPYGLKIFQYNVNRLDSIPYLIEHTRHGEPWAYEVLSDCCRFGKGDPESIINAFGYYDMADRYRAAEYLIKADEYGALSKEGAGLLCHCIQMDPSSRWLNISDNDLARIKHTASISNIVSDVHLDNDIEVCDTVYVIEDIS